MHARTRTRARTHARTHAHTHTHTHCGNFTLQAISHNVTDWSIMADSRNLKLCIVAKTLQNQSRLSKNLVASCSLPNHKISGELKSCDSTWIYPPLWTSLAVAMHYDIETRSIAQSFTVNSYNPNS